MPPTPVKRAILTAKEPYRQVRDLQGAADARAADLAALQAQIESGAVALQERDAAVADLQVRGGCGEVHLRRESARAR